MTSARLGWVAGIVVGVAVAAWRGSAVAAEKEPARTPDKFCVNLTLSNLPPLSTALARAVARHAAPSPDAPDWQRHQRRATLVPRLDIRYGVGKARFRDYAIVNHPEEMNSTMAEPALNSFTAGEHSRWLNTWEMALLWDFSH